MRNIVLFFKICIFSGLLQAGTVLTEYKWTKPQIVVCWADLGTFSMLETEVSTNLQSQNIQMINKDDKSLVENAVKSQYSIGKVGIEFIGWSDCSEVEKYDIAIFGDSTEIHKGAYDFPRGKAELGTSKLINEVFSKRIKPGYLYLKIAADIKYDTTDFKQKTIIATALHEFGHIAGLAHEHNRQEARDDLNCIEIDQSEFFKKPDFVYVTSYDQNSIMNYCNVHSLINNRYISADSIQLSEKDIESIKYLYKK